MKMATNFFFHPLSATNPAFRFFFIQLIASNGSLTKMTQNNKKKNKTTFSRLLLLLLLLLFVMCRQNVDNENDYEWLHAGGVCVISKGSYKGIQPCRLLFEIAATCKCR